MTAYAELCQIFAQRELWQFDPGWPAATMSGSLHQTSKIVRQGTGVVSQSIFPRWHDSMSAFGCWQRFNEGTYPGRRLYRQVT